MVEYRAAVFCVSCSIRNKSCLQILYESCDTGIVIIIISVTNIGLRHSLGKANPEDHDMLNTMQRAKKILFADIVVKMVGLIIAVVIYPQAMMLSVLITLIVFVMTHQVLAR